MKIVEICFDNVTEKWVLTYSFSVILINSIQ